MADNTITNHDNTNDQPTEYETPTETPTTNTATPLHTSTELPPGWKEYTHNNRPYFHNKTTNTTQWKRPDPIPALTHIHTVSYPDPSFTDTPTHTHTTSHEHPHIDPRPYGYEVHVAQARQTINYSLKAALATSHGEAYRAPLAKELNGMFSSGALRPIPITDVKANETINRSIMMYYPKYKTARGIYVLDKLKCRLVFYGKDQIQGIHYIHKASSSPRMATVRTFFATTAPDEDIDQADVSQAYLKAYQDTPDGARVIMRLPRDIAIFVNGVEEVYAVERAVYGQANAGLLWQNTFAGWATDAHFVRSTVDPCVFYLHSTDKDNPGTATMLLYTDDIAIKGNAHIAKHARKLITEKWKCAFEPCEYYLNMKITRNERGDVIISQEHYVNDLVELYRITDTAPTPMEPGTTVHKMDRATHDATKQKPKRTAVTTTEEPTHRHLEFTPDMEPSCKSTHNLERPLDYHEISKYQSLIGALMYLTNATRPDIAAALATLGTVFAAPRLKHWRFALGILRYLKGTNNYTLRYTQNQSANTHAQYPWETYTANIIIAFVDASYADGKNSTSRTGWVIIINGTPVAWRSKGQTIQAQSTMEAEVIAACDVTNEIRFLRDLLFEFNMPQHKPTTVHEDNQACIKYCDTLSVTDRNKYMGTPVNLQPGLPTHFPIDDTHTASRQVRINYHTVKRAVTEGIAKFVYVTTDKQLADVFTKNLPTRTHHTFTSGMLKRTDLSHDQIRSNTQNNKRIADTQLTVSTVTHTKHTSPQRLKYIHNG
jgi:hypothetical protein